MLTWHDANTCGLWENSKVCVYPRLRLRLHNKSCRLLVYIRTFEFSQTPIWLCEHQTASVTSFTEDALLLACVLALSRGVGEGRTRKGRKTLFPLPTPSHKGGLILKLRSRFGQHQGSLEPGSWVGNRAKKTKLASEAVRAGNGEGGKQRYPLPHPSTRSARFDRRSIPQLSGAWSQALTKEAVVRVFGHRWTKKHGFWRLAKQRICTVMSMNKSLL